MTETTETMRRHAFDCGIGSGAELEFIHDADRLARLEDGIRALADELDPGEIATGEDEMHQRLSGRLRALLGEGE